MELSFIIYSLQAYKIQSITENIIIHLYYKFKSIWTKLHNLELDIGYHDIIPLFPLTCIQAAKSIELKISGYYWFVPLSYQSQQS